MDDKKILQHLQEERDISMEFVRPKRELFRQRIKDYTNVTIKDDNIYVRLIYSVMQTLMSLHYTDEMSVEFAGRQLGANEIAQNLQHLAEFDYEEMGLDKIRYKSNWDRLFYGVGIEVFDYWDDLKKCPIYRRMSPLIRLPDPSPDDLTGHRRHQFEFEVNSNTITKENGYMNAEKVQADLSDELDRDKDAYRDTRSLSNTRRDEDTLDSRMIPVHYCYTTIEGKKRFVVTALDHGVIIKKEEIKPVFDEEKDKPELIKYPVFTYHYSPVHNDPFGVSVPDLLSDKQHAQQLFLNLQKIKAEHSARGDTFLVDPNQINVSDLQTPTKGPRYIKMKGGGTLANAMMELPKSSVGGDIQAVASQIQYQATLDIGLDERSMGVSGDRSITATENQRIQQNANLKQVLHTRLIKQGLKRFRYHRHRCYHENFKPTDEKNMILNTRIGSRPITVKQEDIHTGMHIDITITAKSEREAKNKEKLVTFMGSLQLIMQNPGSSAIAKTLAQREMLMLSGSTPEEARLYITPSLEEEQAKNDLMLINENEVPRIDDMTEDHMTYMVLYHRAINTPAKFSAIEARKQAYILSGQKAKQAQLEQQAGGQGGGIMAQMANQSMQQQPEQQAQSLGSNPQ